MTAYPAVLDGKLVVLVRLFRCDATELLTSDAYLAVDNGKYTLRVAVPASALDELVPVRQILPVEEFDPLRRLHRNRILGADAKHPRCRKCGKQESRTKSRSHFLFAHFILLFI